MAKVLRENRARGVNLSFDQLNAPVRDKLHRLKYNQTPDLIGASERIAGPLPWSVAAKGAVAKRLPAKRGAKKRAPAKRKSAARR